MTGLVVFLGLAGGVGLVISARAFMRRRLTAAQMVLGAAGVQEAGASAALRHGMTWLEGQLRGKPEMLQDAAMVGRSFESHVVAKVTGLVVGTALLGGVGGLAGALGLGIPVGVIVVIAILGAVVGWWIPDSMLKTEAAKARKHFQQVTESWLELAGQLVTAGTDTLAALQAAASYSDQPTFIALRDALRQAAARGEPPWTGLRRLADERRLRFLDPFCSALELSGTTGAGSRETILSQVESTRSKALHEADAKAASSGEKMGAPLALIGGSFMILIGYPPLAGIMESGSFSTGGI